MSSAATSQRRGERPGGRAEPAPAPARAPRRDRRRRQGVARSRAAPPRRSNVDIGALAGSGPAGRIVKADVLAAAERRPAGARRGDATVLRGGAAMLAHYMDESLTLPTATSFRTIVVTRARRAPPPAQGGRRAASRSRT